MKVKYQQILEDYEMPDPEKVTLKQIDALQKSALETQNGAGNRYELMASVILLGEALKIERSKSK